MTDIFFFKGALLVYLISTLAYVASLFFRRVHIAKTATGILLAAFLLHSAALVSCWVRTECYPFGGLYPTLSFFAWVLGGIYLLLQLRTKTRVLGAFVSPVIFVLMLAASAGLGDDVAVSAALRGNLVAVHVILAVGGEALFVLASLAGAMYLLQDSRIKQKRSMRLSRYLPSLDDLDRINRICLLWGFLFLTVGILAGSVWARVTWGSHWQWDPKQVWTFTAWLAFALLLHQRLAIGWRGHKAALLSVLAFVLLLLALGIEKLFFQTVHRFL